MNVLITGGSGYIGGRLALHLKEAGNFNIFLGSRTKNINSQLLKDINYLEPRAKNNHLDSSIFIKLFNFKFQKASNIVKSKIKFMENK